MTERVSYRRYCALLACATFAPLIAGCNRPESGVEPKSADGPRQIVALGRLDPAGGVLQIGAIPGDVLKKFADGVAEGATVDAESELAFLQSYDLRARNLDVVYAKLRVGRQQRDQEVAVAVAGHQRAIAAKAEADARLEEFVAQEQALEGLAEAARITTADYQSLVKLEATDPDLVTEIQLRRKRNDSERAVNEFEVKKLTHAAGKKAATAAVVAAEANLKLTKLNLDMAEQIDRNEVTEIEKKVAEETLEQSVLRAPKDAEGGSGKFTILKIFVKPGEFITQLPVLQIGDTSRMVCIAEVYEADVKEIKIGQRVSIHSPALSAQYADSDPEGSAHGGLPGKVLKVGTLVSSAGLMQRNPLAPADRSIVEVVVDIVGDNDEATASATKEAAAHIGMQVTVTFLEEETTGSTQQKRPASPSAQPIAGSGSGKAPDETK